MIGIIFATNRVGQLFKPKTRSTKRGLIGLEMAIKGVQEKGKIGATRATQMDINWDSDFIQKLAFSNALRALGQS